MTPTTVNQFRNAFANAPRAQANRLRDFMTTSVQKKERKELLEDFQMLKTAARIACFISGGVFAAFPNLFVGCLSAVVVYVAYEVNAVATNVEEILQDVTIESKCRGNKQALLDQMSKGTCLSRYVIPLIW